MKISVIMASLNREDTIGRAIESVLCQSYKNFELIVQDGQSTDATLKIVNEFNDNRIIVESRRDQGIYDALNKGIERASGDVIGFLHTDDVLCTPDIFQLIVDSLTDPCCAGVYGDLRYSAFGNPNRVVRNWISGHFDLHKVKRGWMIPHPTFYLKRYVYDECGPFDLQFSISADYEMFLRIVTAYQYKFNYINKTMVNMSLGGASNGSVRKIFQKSYEDYQILNRYGFPAVFTLVSKNLSKLRQFCA